MRRPLAVTLAVAGTSAGVLAGGIMAGASQSPTVAQQSELTARSVLPARSFRPGSPPSGAFFTTQNRADAAANGVAGPATGPYFAEQPIQGISSMVPAGNGSWWALADNGYGTRDTSADWQLPIYRLDPGFGSSAGPQVLDTVILSDPDHRVPWTIVCDPGHGTPLPPFTFNVLPATPAPAS